MRIARPPSLLLLLAFLACSALAQPPGSVWLAELTSPEVRDAVRSGYTTIIVPIGGTEQNGPHMVLGKHNVRAGVLAERIALKLGDALVAPVIAYVPEGSFDPPTAHLRYAGTIGIAPDAFRKLLEGAARSFRLHGFRDIVFVGDHGGYQSDERAVAERLTQQWRASGVRVHAIGEYYRVTETEFVAALKQRGYSDDEIGTHAGLADTSLALAVDPRLVHLDRLAAAAASKDSGVHGDPRRASADIGRIGVDLIVDRTVAAIRAAQRR